VCLLDNPKSDKINIQNPDIEEKIKIKRNKILYESITCKTDLKEANE